MGVRHGVRATQVGPDQEKTPVPADRPVQRHLRCPAVPGDPPDLPHDRRQAADQAGRVQQGLQRSGDSPGPLPDVAGQQLPWARRGPGYPGWRRRGLLIGTSVEQRADHRDSGDSIGDDVMQPDEHPDVAVGQAGQEPHLPERARPVQRPFVQFRAQAEQGRLIPGRRDRASPDVLADIEPGGVRPGGRAQAGARRDEHLAQPGREMEAPLHVGPHDVHPQVPGPIEKRRAFQDDQRRDVHRQAAILDAQIAHVQRRQAVWSAARPASASDSVRNLRMLHSSLCSRPVRR